MAVTSAPVPATTDRPLLPAAERSRVGHDWAWALQAVTGIAVLALVTLHMAAQHFMVEGGLRDYAAVVAWLASPLIVVLEVAFLASVTWHALLGVRAILFDFGFSARTERLITRVLAVIGLVAVGYGLWLTGVIVSQA